MKTYKTFKEFLDTSEDSLISRQWHEYKTTWNETIIIEEDINF